LPLGQLNAIVGTLFLLALAYTASACAPRQVAVQCSVEAAGAAPIYIAAGRVARTIAHEPEEQWRAEGAVAAFEIDAHEVTNEQFAAFVAATGYRTIAERPGADGRPLGAAVFDRTTGAWRVDAAANWRHPEGARSSIVGRERHPVVSVAFQDAEAYAQWAGRRLPSELEWERAARGDGPAPTQTTAEAFNARGEPVANTWQGVFPIDDSGEDGFRGSAPVGCFPPNANGLYDMIGNVWEWTSDLYDAPNTAPDAAANARVLKGGSHLCARNFCSRFRSGSRQPGDPGLGMSHVGFRTAVSRP